jgi:hypothetical protein
MEYQNKPIRKLLDIQGEIPTQQRASSRCPVSRLLPTKCSGRLPMHGQQIKPNQTKKRLQHLTARAANIVALLLLLLAAPALTQHAQLTIEGPKYAVLVTTTHSTLDARWIEQQMEDAAVPPDPRPDIVELMVEAKRTADMDRAATVREPSLLDYVNPIRLLQGATHYNITDIPSSATLARSGDPTALLPSTFKLSMIQATPELDTPAKVIAHTQAAFAATYPDLRLTIHAVRERKTCGKTWVVKFSIAPVPGNHEAAIKAIPMFCATYAKKQPTFTFPILVGDTIVQGVPLLRFAEPAVSDQVLNECTLSGCDVSNPPALYHPMEWLSVLLADILDIVGTQDHWLLKLLETADIGRVPTLGSHRYRYDVVLCNSASAKALSVLGNVHLTVYGPDYGEHTFQLDYNPDRDARLVRNAASNRDRLQWSVGTNIISPPSLVANPAQMLAFVNKLLGFRV